MIQLQHTQKTGDVCLTGKKAAFQLRLDEDLHQKVKEIADKEFRSLNAQIEYFIHRGIAEYENEHGAIHEMENVVP